MLPRRAFLDVAGWGGAGIAAQLTSDDRPSPTRVAAALARDLRNGWGVCGRPGFDAGIDAYAAMMGQIGARDLRTPLVQDRISAQPRLELLHEALAKAGLAAPVPRVTALVTAYLNDLGTNWDRQQAALLAFAGTGMLRAIEGPNEINNVQTGGGSHGPGDTVDRTGPGLYPANARAWAEAIGAFRARHGQALAGVRLVAPSIASGRQADYAALPNLAGLVDAGNVHFYAGRGRQPGFSIAGASGAGTFENILAWARAAQLPGGPMWLTEAGASTSGNYARDGVSQAKYIANQFFDFFATGGQRLFFYQLLDGSGAPGEIEGNFGLFRHDGTPKPAAVLLGHLKHLLSLDLYDDPRNASDVQPFVPAYDARALAVSGIGATSWRLPPQTLVLHKSDGSTMIAVWNEPVIDDGQGRSLAPTLETVTLDFGSVQTFSVHDLMAAAPLTGTTPRGTPFDTARSVALAMRGYPMLVELRGRGSSR